LRVAVAFTTPNFHGVHAAHSNGTPVYVALKTTQTTHDAPVQVLKHLNSRTLLLNRPKALNALSLDMIRILATQLTAFDESELCRLVMLKGTGRAFCAGGDVKRAFCRDARVLTDQR
jgi:enoyl-CoA hydratase/carnithine racemase